MTHLYAYIRTYVLLMYHIASRPSMDDSESDGE